MTGAKMLSGYSVVGMIVGCDNCVQMMIIQATSVFEYPMTKIVCGAEDVVRVLGGWVYLRSVESSFRLCRICDDVTQLF